jgi:hypothetical protein
MENFLSEYTDELRTVGLKIVFTGQERSVQSAGSAPPLHVG